MVKRKDFAALEKSRVAGVTTGIAARDAMRSRMAAPPSKLALADVQRNPRNPRDSVSDPEIREMAATVRRIGQLQPALVIPVEDYQRAYPDQAVGPQSWVAIIGNRRHLAAELAEATFFDVRTTEGLDTADAIEDAILVENLQRRELEPLREAEMLQQRLDRTGQSLRSVGEAIGKSHAYVSQRLSLLKLIPELQQCMRDEQLNVKTARQLAGLSAAEQQTIFAAGPPFEATPVRRPAKRPTNGLPTDPGGDSGAPPPSPPKLPSQPPSPEAATTDEAADTQSVDDGVAEAASGGSGGERAVAPIERAIRAVLEEVRSVRSTNESLGEQQDLALHESAQHLDAALTAIARV